MLVRSDVQARGADVGGPAAGRRCGAWLGWLLVGLMATGCATSGGRFDPDSIARIQPGRTTQADVRRMFGTPVRVRTNAAGVASWTYDYREEINRDTGMLSRIGVWVARMLGHRAIYSPVNVSYRNEIQHKLTLLFDRAGVVDDYTYERTDRPSRRVY